MKRFDAILNWWFIQSLITIAFIIASLASAVVFEFTVGSYEAQLILWGSGLLLITRGIWWVNNRYRGLTTSP